MGTEEGDIYLATTEFSTEFLMQYCSHSTPINSLAWNPHYSGGGARARGKYLYHGENISVFLSCAAEYAVAVWHKDYSEPLLMYDLGSQVRCHWSHYLRV